MDLLSYDMSLSPLNCLVSSMIRTSDCSACSIEFSAASTSHQILKYATDYPRALRFIIVIQVGLLGMGRTLQRDLDRIAGQADTTTAEGLHYVLTGAPHFPLRPSFLSRV